MEIAKEVSQWMKGYELKFSIDNVVEPYRLAGIPFYDCELDAGRLKLTPYPRPIDESEVDIARRKLSELFVATKILDECSCAHYIYTECIKDMPSCDFQKMLENILMIFIIVRLFASDGHGYNDAICHCLESNHNEFKSHWNVLKRLRDKSIVHTDANPYDKKTRHSEGIDNRITQIWDDTRGVAPPYIVFTDEYVRDSSIDVPSFLGTVRLSPRDREAVDKIIRPHSNSLRGILRYMYQTWHRKVFRLDEGTEADPREGKP